MATRAMPRLADLADDFPPMRRAFKIVVTGPVGAGKTTFINTISEIRTIGTEAGISDGSATQEKATTTVGFDFGQIALRDEMELYLFGTPGQDRFDFVWDVLSKGMLGVILLLDCERPDTWPAGRAMLDYFRARGDAHVPVIVAANKVTDFAIARDGIALTLGLTEHDFVVPTDARDRQAVKQTLIELLELVVASLV
jgi:uncharacterized protein